MSEIRALIVDDSSVMRKIVERRCARRVSIRWWCTRPETGWKALEVLRTEQVDLILTDINMPAMDGLEFVRQIRAQNLAPACRW